MTNKNHLYSDRDTRLNTLIGSDQSRDHWRSLQQARAEYINQCLEQDQAFELLGFSQWLEDVYGVRLERIDGMIGQSFEVVDPDKYLIYQLKFA